MQALRTAFFLLVLGNLLLFAYAKGYLSSPAGDGDAQRLVAQFHPEQIRIVSRGAPPRVVEPSPEICRAFADLSAAQAAELVTTLRGRDDRIRLEQRAIAEPSAWWVYLPAQKTRRDAEKKAAELKKLDIEDFFIFQEGGPHQYALSLGLYKSEQGANEQLERLRKKGVRSARIQVRETPTDKFIVEARGAQDRMSRALAGPTGELTSADCSAPR